MKPWLIGSLVVAVAACAIGVTVLLQDDSTDGTGYAQTESATDEAAGLAPELPAPAADAGRVVPRPLAPVENELPDAAGLTDRAVDAASLMPAETREDVAITGRVLDTNGRPVEGAKVSLLSDVLRMMVRDRAGDDEGVSMPDLPTANTDREGRFRIDGSIRVDAEPSFPAELFGASQQLAVQHDRFATLVKPLSGLRPPAWDTGDLYLEPGAWIHGRAVDEAGRPLADAFVTAQSHSEDHGRRGGFSVMMMGGGMSSTLDAVTTGGDGRFTVRGLSAGTGSVTVQKTGLRLAVKEDLTLEPLQGTDVGDVVLEPGSQIAGVVLDARGEAIEGASVSVSSMSRLVLNRIEDMPRQQIGQEFGQRATTDADGRFELGGLGGGTYTVHVMAEGHDMLSVEDVPSGSNDLRLHPVRLGSLLLRLRDAASGEPVDGAIVAATPQGGTRWMRAESTVPVLQGEEALAALGRSGDPAGIYLVQHAGLEGTELVVAAEGRAREAIEAPAVPSGQVVELPVDLVPEAALSGFVRGPGGEPIPRALVRLGKSEPEQSFDFASGRRSIERTIRVGGEDRPSATRQTTRSAPDGSFRFGGLAAGDWEVWARAEGYVAGEREAVTLAQAEGQEDVVLLLQPAGAVVGTVTQRDGTPVAGADVSVQPVGSPSQGADGGGRGGRRGRGLAMLGLGGREDGGGRRVRTAADGRYRADGLAAGEYEVRLGADPLHGGAFGGAIMIRLDESEDDGDPPDAFATVKPGEDTTIDLVKPEQSTLRGRVMAGGRAAPHVTVTMRESGALPFGGATSETDDRGAFVFEDVAAGEYTLSAIVPGAALEETVDVELASGESRSVDIVFGGSTLSGRVVGEGTDIGVAGLTITAAPMVEDQGGSGAPQVQLEFIGRVAGGGGGSSRGMSMTIGGGPVSSVRTDSEGRFELLYVKPGTFRIEAGGEGYVRSSLDDVKVMDGEDRDDLRLSVRRGAVVRGVVTDGKTGARLGQVPLRLSGSSTREMTVTEEDGGYLFEGLDSGEYTISVLGSGFGSEPIASEMLSLEVGEDRSLDLKTEG
ncbi:MAG: carboxypeptidase regulatory-like domain-containing protein [Planctomycetota bacterium]|jgi:protocatechuate 3,4-dioxygenase beta subunit